MNAHPIDHVGIVVKDLARAIRAYTDTLGFQEIYRERIAEQGIEAVGLQAGNAVVELLQPFDENSSIARYRGDHETRLHHIAYQVLDLEAEIARLTSAGVRMIDERPRNGAHGNRIAFIHPSSTGGVLTELCQRALSP